MLGGSLSSAVTHQLERRKAGHTASRITIQSPRMIILSSPKRLTSASFEICGVSKRMACTASIECAVKISIPMDVNEHSMLQMGTIVHRYLPSVATTLGTILVDLHV